MESAHSHNKKLRRDLILKKLVQEQRWIGQDVARHDKYLFGDNLNKKITEEAGVNNSLILASTLLERI